MLGSILGKSLARANLARRHNGWTPWTQRRENLMIGSNLNFEMAQIVENEFSINLVEGIDSELRL